MERYRRTKEACKVVKFLEPFGDASYSTYLVHGLAITMLLRVWEAPSAWFVPMGLAVATVAGLGVHLVVEKPILQAATSLWKSRRPEIVT